MLKFIYLRRIDLRITPPRSAHTSGVKGKNESHGHSRLHPLPQIPHLELPLEGLGLKRAPGCRREILVGAEERAEGMHVLAEPAHQRRELTAPRRRQELGDRGARRLEELGPGERA